MSTECHRLPISGERSVAYKIHALSTLHVEVYHVVYFSAAFVCGLYIPLRVSHIHPSCRGLSSGLFLCSIGIWPLYSAQSKNCPAHVVFYRIALTVSDVTSNCEVSPNFLTRVTQ
jgi:hypothetical protein